MRSVSRTEKKIREKGKREIERCTDKVVLFSVGSGKDRK